MADTLFGDVIALESRREAILAGFGEAEQTDELVAELADIETDLQGHYEAFSDREVFTLSTRFGVPL